MPRRIDPTFDLAMLETLNARVNAARDVKRAERHVESEKPFSTSRIDRARRHLESAMCKSAVAKDLLDSAILTMAEERA